MCLFLYQWPKKPFRLVVLYARWENPPPAATLWWIFPCRSLKGYTREGRAYFCFAEVGLYKWKKGSKFGCLPHSWMMSSFSSNVDLNYIIQSEKNVKDFDNTSHKLEAIYSPTTRLSSGLKLFITILFTTQTNPICTLHRVSFCIEQLVILHSLFKPVTL